MRITPINIDSVDFKRLKISEDELKTRLLIPNTICIYEKDICLIVAANRNGNIYLDVFEVVDIKKHLKSVLSAVKEAIKPFGTDTFYMEMDKKNPHNSDYFYKKSQKVFENSKKIIYRRSIK